MHLTVEKSNICNATALPYDDDADDDRGNDDDDFSLQGYSSSKKQKY